MRTELLPTTVLPEDAGIRVFTLQSPTLQMSEIVTGWHAK